MNRDNTTDAQFREYVRENAVMGFGRMMQIVSEEWYRDATLRGDPTHGVFVGYPLGLLKGDDERLARRGLEQALEREKPHDHDDDA